MDVLVALTYSRPEAICAQENKMSHWLRGRKGSHAGGRGVSAFQVSNMQLLLIISISMSSGIQISYAYW